MSAVMERLSPMGADAKSLRREAKRSFGLALGGPEHDCVKIESMESPTKKPALGELQLQPQPQPLSSKPAKPSKSASTSANSAAAKRKAVLHSEVAALQDVVEGIQRQVNAASKGIQELKQLVDSHLVTNRTDEPDYRLADAPMPMIACVSPPASFLTLDQEDEGLEELVEFLPPQPTKAQDYMTMGDAMMFYGGTPMPFTC